MVNCDTAVEPRKQGIARVDDVSYVWAVFDRAKAEDEVGWVADTGNTEFAERLTGWRASYRGPGRSFADEPGIRVFKHAVLVTQRRGLDI